jgi:hypothetical protein
MMNPVLDKRRIGKVDFQVTGKACQTSGITSELLVTQPPFDFHIAFVLRF